MDLGKMLTEAFDGQARVSWVDYPTETNFDLTAVAEAFLAKVREAEGIKVTQRGAGTLESSEKLRPTSTNATHG